MRELLPAAGCGADVQFVLLPRGVGCEWSACYRIGCPQRDRPVPRFRKRSDSGQYPAISLLGHTQTGVRQKLRPSQFVRLLPDGCRGFKQWWGIFTLSVVIRLCERISNTFQNFNFFSNCLNRTKKRTQLLISIFSTPKYV